jgi:L-ascorbate metabolism protein UlaG (beta-lactamase superfamily)
MNITYLGHSAFKLKGKMGTVVTDPFSEYIGFALPGLSADIVTVSHDHPDHNAVDKIGGTARRQRPFFITEAGEYEVGGVSVFGTTLFHDNTKGVERGQSIAYTILLDDLRICHLGDLGHELTADDAEKIGNIDILLCPVGGVFTIDPATAVKVIRSLEPSIVIPMHFRTPQHKSDLFGELKTLEDFTREYGAAVAPVKKLDVERSSLPEETELVILDVSSGAER